MLSGIQLVSARFSCAAQHTDGPIPSVMDRRRLSRPKDEADILEKRLPRSCDGADTAGNGVVRQVFFRQLVVVDVSALPMLGPRRQSSARSGGVHGGRRMINLMNKMA